MKANYDLWAKNVFNGYCIKAHNKIFKGFFKVLRINHYVITGVYNLGKKLPKNAATCAEVAVSKEVLTSILYLVSVFRIKLLVNQ